MAAATLLAIQGCAPGSAADAAPGTGQGPAYVQTLTQARNVFSTYVKVSAAAAASGDEAQGLATVADAQWAQVKGQYRALVTAGTPVARYQYGPPRFSLPAPAGYPRWFMVTAPRSTEVGGRLGPAVTTIMVFEQARAHQPWTLDSTAALGQPLPALAYHSDGYAVAEPALDAGVLLRPDVVGPTQAAVADQGPGSPAAAVISAGPQTTGLYAAQAAQARSDQASGLVYQWLLEGTPFPQFQLRLQDGGDLVIYGMYLNTTIEHPGLAAGSPIAAPAGFSPLFAASTEVGYHAVSANWTDQFAAIDPPAAATHGQVDIIGASSGPSYGHAY